ncbi:MAG: strawberry notch C-terminal domain-containing protein [Microcystaceae cyanobacterium]
MSKAKGRALSTFWGHHQRFFNYLMNSLKLPSLITAIEEDLKNDYAVVIQLITTNEALLDRKLSTIPTSEWDDIKTDISPRQAVHEYLNKCFPTLLWEEYEDENGNTKKRQVLDADGNPVHCQEALRIKHETIEDLALLPSMPTVIDGLIWHFGYQNVAEVTGRSKRVITEGDKLKLVKRSEQASLAEKQAFMDGDKNILIFSQAGGTGASYHSDITCHNQRQRKHYVVETGFSASVAIQGLGRTHRASQVTPPIFIPVTLNVKGIKRFDSAIARKVESLGALTKGSSKTGSQNLWSESDNLENIYSRMALQDLFYAIYHNQVEGIDANTFSEKTGLTLVGKDGYLLTQMPPVNQFLNRLMALEIHHQNAVFTAFEQYQHNRIQEAIDNGTYSTGVTNLKAEGFRVLEEIELYTHETGNKTTAIKIERKDKVNLITLDQLMKYGAPTYYWNARSNSVALGVEAVCGINADGSFDRRMRLYSPDDRYQSKTYYEMSKSHWQEIEFQQWQVLWETQRQTYDEYRYSVFYLIVGMLTPVYSKFPQENMKIYRLQADDGRVFLGRYIADSDINRVLRSFRLIQSDLLSPDELWNACYNRHETHVISEDPEWKVTSSRVAGDIRLEVTGVHEREDLRALTSLGCFTEIISGQLRVFVPTIEEEAKAILGQILS